MTTISFGFMQLIFLLYGCVHGGWLLLACPREMQQFEVLPTLLPENAMPPNGRNIS
jgi:hypothetical protein